MGIVSFNGHPPLGVNATFTVTLPTTHGHSKFQWAPTLGGECYDSVYGKRNRVANPFQWAPTLGGECYRREFRDLYHSHPQFQWAPTLGGECYWLRDYIPLMGERVPFQWAPTLGGECYRHSKHSAVRATRKCGFNGHPPLGVNATAGFSLD